MSFREIDEARKIAAAIANDKRERGRKRRSALISESDAEGKDVKKRPMPDDKNGEPSDRRTGRWTQEEITFCDKMITLFKDGRLPITEGVKLNDFLANMLKSKQSRLTKKMKNAKLSSITFSRRYGHIFDSTEARSFSELEDQFFNSIHDHLERAEIKFHMQKEWRELFSNYCAAMGQHIEANAWLSSVEEMDRRSSLARDAARMTRRKLMMGYALCQDSQNADPGVFIEKTEAEMQSMQNGEPLMFSKHGTDMTTQDNDDLLYFLDDNVGCEYPNSLGGMSPHQLSAELNGKSSMLHSSPFMRRITAYMKRHKVPFEHVDVWVPSFVPNDEPNATSDSNCRLCFAGSATSDTEILQHGNVPVKNVPKDAHFNLQAFGDYSQKFSFDVGCGLPGRVYDSGIPTWEQSVHTSSNAHFERSGAAQQWGIKTVVGIPVASPNVGRVVVVFYSRHDRSKDQDLVFRLSKELTRLMPSPKWKLIVDTSYPPPNTKPASIDERNANKEETEDTTRDNTIKEIITLLCQYMPSNPNSTLASYCDAFVSLRLLLLRPTRSQEDEDNVRIMIGSYTSYKSSGRSSIDICIMLACDFQFLQRSATTSTSPTVKNEHAKAMPQYVFTPPQAQPQSDLLSYGNGTSPMLSPVHMSQNILDNVSIISA
eukprot:CAMPEP_0197834302 /NCGR_PEP_ID=MMETSP1437-20131217/21946_1 /TAXON_ID=49252 ORGANISM="Eucampia antarctica, Strain CCMP1452" /NCGR_SAMPLE_ID=MMETSP1437 /ASSEMBLY_ACC=CAM_ASM_001096 /LENGTH=654 /DNA_ID=CAMNT_0043438877 /DNA_START=278 /DNA_END=2242 /DNA_ORIENTATION=-